MRWLRVTPAAKVRPKMVQLGETTAVDPEEVSAVYLKENGRILVVRIGGMGVIELERSQLSDTPKFMAALLTAAVNSTRGY